ncbi:MAG: DNA repair exonuclease [Candidatus Eisenbacteria bacterium]|nr:DNA repair exonuclease [Candidatus Eisenbacteria bacterium]
MAAFRFVHVADVHLDARFKSRDEHLRERLAGALRDSFSNAVELALREGVHAFLVAGDLFHTPEIAYGTERFLINEFEKLAGAGIAVFYAHGNHDPGGAASPLAGIRWPDGVEVFRDGTPRAVEVKDADGRPVGRITGAGHATSAEGENLAACFPAAVGPLPEVALLHANVEGGQTAGEHERYAPCVAADLEGKGYDYWALGHIHLRQAIDARVAARYSGCVLGLYRNETGPKGALFVEVERGAAPKVVFQATAPLLWERIEVNLGGAEDVDAARERIAAAIGERFGGAGDVLVTVGLLGETPAAPRLRDRETRVTMEEEIAGEAGLDLLKLETGNLRSPVDEEEMRLPPLGELLDFVAVLREGREPIAPLAPEKLAAAPDKAAAREEYLRSLLDGAEEELIRRMWRDEP